MKYKVGDKVRIVSEKVGEHWNDNGLMDKWLGKIMTIRKLSDEYYKMVEDEDDWGCGWFWFEYMIECKVEDDKDEIKKGVDNNMVQDFYRAITNKKGMVKFQPLKMVNLCFVKFSENGKVYTFNNPTDKRLKVGTKVLVDSAGKDTKGTVVSSIKLPKKYLADLQMAMSGKHTPLKDVLGVIDIKKSIVEKEVVTKFGDIK